MKEVKVMFIIAIMLVLTLMFLGYFVFFGALGIILINYTTTFLVRRYRSRAEAGAEVLEPAYSFGY